jgi:hypothetical protein
VTSILQQFPQIFLASVMVIVTASAQTGTDTAKAHVNPQSKIRITARMHSMGLFGYAGVIANVNPSADVLVGYERKRWGAIALKAFDLYDLHSSYNFMLGLVHYNIPLSKRLTVTPYLGAVIEQREKIADKGSDGMLLVISSFRIAEHVRFEHCARFANVMVEQNEFDWLNRFRLLYSRKHLDLAAMYWNNNHVFDECGYTTVGLNAAVSRLKLTENISLSTGVTGVLLADTFNEVKNNFTNGLLFTIAATFEN